MKIELFFSVTASNSAYMYDFYIRASKVKWDCLGTGTCFLSVLDNVLSCAKLRY